MKILRKLQDKQIIGEYARKLAKELGAFAKTRVIALVRGIQSALQMQIFDRKALYL